MSDLYVFRVVVDPKPQAALEEFLEEDRAEIAEALRAGKIQLYGVVYTRECPEHGPECPHAEDLDDFWSLAAQPGIEGSYRKYEDIPDEALRALALHMLLERRLPR